MNCAEAQEVPIGDGQPPIAEGAESTAFQSAIGKRKSTMCNWHVI
jgi:hypothetical protein